MMPLYINVTPHCTALYAMLFFVDELEQPLEGENVPTNTFAVDFVCYLDERN